MYCIISSYNIHCRQLNCSTKSFQSKHFRKSRMCLFIRKHWNVRHSERIGRLHSCRPAFRAAGKGSRYASFSLRFCFISGLRLECNSCDIFQQIESNHSTTWALARSATWAIAASDASRHSSFIRLHFRQSVPAGHEAAEKPENGGRREALWRYRIEREETLISLEGTCDRRSRGSLENRESPRDFDGSGDSKIGTKMEEKVEGTGGAAIDSGAASVSLALPECVLAVR